MFDQKFGETLRIAKERGMRGAGNDFEPCLGQLAEQPARSGRRHERIVFAMK